MVSHQLTRTLVDMGADDVRVADTARLEELPTYPEDLLQGYRRAVSMCVRLADPLVDTVEGEPTPLYAQHVDRVSSLLDDMALRGASVLQRAGYRAMPMPASQILDNDECVSYVSHKAVAVASGLGWQGKSLLVIHPEHGPRIRLNTILTDAPLRADEPMRNRCGKCNICYKACPSGAIRGVKTDYHYSSREEALDFEKCRHKIMDEFATMKNIGEHVCGVCVKVCPWGQKASRKRRRR